MDDDPVPKLYAFLLQGGFSLKISETNSSSVHWTVPNFKVPAGACDCHVHVFEAPEKFPFSPKRLYTPGSATVEDLSGLLGGLGLERVVVVQATPYGTDNSCLLDALDRLEGRARGVVVMEEGISGDEINAMHRHGVRGARVNLETVGAKDPVLAARLLTTTAERIAPFGWHVQTYTNLGVISALRDVIAALPVPLVIDHFGLAYAKGGLAQSGFDALLSLITAGAVYVKLSAPYRISEALGYQDVGVIARALISANPDRMLWGSDWPHPSAQPNIPRDPARIEPFRPENDGQALDFIHQCAGDSVMKKILVDNPWRLYGF